MTDHRNEVLATAINIGNYAVLAKLYQVPIGRRTMNPLSVFCESVKVSLDTGPGIHDITPALEQLIDDLRVEDGNLNATMVGSKRPGMTATGTVMCRPRYWGHQLSCRSEKGA